MKVDENNEEMNTLFKNGIINTHLCVNAMTAESHTEMDTLYTIICVPKQIDRNYKRLETRFLFHLNDTNTLEIKMFAHMDLIYSGYMLNHHQIFNKDYLKDTKFINIASYGNKRLFHNMLSSFERMIE